MIDNNEQPEKIINISVWVNESRFVLGLNIVLCILSMLLLITMGYDIIMMILPPIFWVIGLLFLIFLLPFIPIPSYESILFYKNMFKCNAGISGILGSNVYKYSSFQKVYLTKNEQIILKTENEKEIATLGTNSQKINSQILTELYNRGKEVIIDDSLYGIYKVPDKQPIKNKIHWTTKFGIFYGIAMFCFMGYIGYADMRLKVSKEFYDSGALKSKTEFKNTTGTMEEYYENGVLKSKSEYKKNKLNGKTVAYDENGKLVMEAEYKNGKQDGITKFYYENGALKSEAKFTDGMENGIDKVYYENGNVLIEMEIKNNKPDGILHQYYENGKIKASANMKDGIGIVSLFDEDGNPIGKQKMVCDGANKCKVED